MSGEAYDVNKQTIYIVPKSTNESRMQYSPEHARGTNMALTDACNSQQTAMDLYECLLITCSVISELRRIPHLSSVSSLWYETTILPA